MFAFRASALGQISYIGLDGRKDIQSVKAASSVLHAELIAHVLTPIKGTIKNVKQTPTLNFFFSFSFRKCLVLLAKYFALVTVMELQLNFHRTFRYHFFLSKEFLDIQVIAECKSAISVHETIKTDSHLTLFSYNMKYGCPSMSFDAKS